MYGTFARNMQGTWDSLNCLHNNSRDIQCALSKHNIIMAHLLWKNGCGIKKSCMILGLKPNNSNFKKIRELGGV